jgi:hypothetical protein
MTRFLLPLLVLACLAGRAAAAPPGPVLTFRSETFCVPEMTVSEPVVLAAEKPAGVIVKVVDVDAMAACLADAGGVRPYALFELPADGRIASVNAGAVIEQKRLLAPRVVTLDADRRVVRAFAPDALMRRGQTLSVLFRPQAQERFVAVLADPGLVGKRLALTLDAGREDLSTPYSYEGQAFARVYVADPAARR